MLDYKDLAELQDFCDSLSDVRRRNLLSQLILEYGQYKRCGSPEDCAQRKEWMEMSYEDIRMSFNEKIQALRNEVSDMKREAAAEPKPKKRGRPRNKKTEDESTGLDNPPRFDSLEERDRWYK